MVRVLGQPQPQWDAASWYGPGVTIPISAESLSLVSWGGPVPTGVLGVPPMFLLCGALQCPGFLLSFLYPHCPSAHYSHWLPAFPVSSAAPFPHSPHARVPCAGAPVPTDGCLADCSGQDEQFSLVFTIGSFMNNFMTLPMGYVFDRFGTAVARLIAM